MSNISPIKSVKEIPIIEIQYTQRNGKGNKSTRLIKEYWTKDGKQIFKEKINVKNECQNDTNNRKHENLLTSETKIPYSLPKIPCPPPHKSKFHRHPI